MNLRVINDCIPTEVTSTSLKEKMKAVRSVYGTNNMGRRSTNHIIERLHTVSELSEKNVDDIRAISNIVQGVEITRSLLAKLNETAVQAKKYDYNHEEIQHLIEESERLKTEIDRVATAIEFNKRRLNLTESISKKDKNLIASLRNLSKYKFVLGKSEEGSPEDQVMLTSLSKELVKTSERLKNVYIDLEKMQARSLSIKYNLHSVAGISSGYIAHKHGVVSMEYGMSKEALSLVSQTKSITNSARDIL